MIFRFKSYFLENIKMARKIFKTLIMLFVICVFYITKYTMGHSGAVTMEFGMTIFNVLSGAHIVLEPNQDPVVILSTYRCVFVHDIKYLYLTDEIITFDLICEVLYRYDVSEQTFLELGYTKEQVVHFFCHPELGIHQFRIWYT